MSLNILSASTHHTHAASQIKLFICRNFSSQFRCFISILAHIHTRELARLYHSHIYTPSHTRENECILVFYFIFSSESLIRCIRGKYIVSTHVKFHSPTTAIRTSPRIHTVKVTRKKEFGVSYTCDDGNGGKTRK